MKKLSVLAALGMFLVAGSPTAAASVGIGIGIPFPMPSSSSGRTTSGESYAAFTFGEMVEELTVTEKNGRLKMELKVTNLSDTPYTVEHQNGQDYDFVISDKNGSELYRWSGGMAFTQAVRTAEYPAHASVVYTAELERRDYRKFKEDAVLVTAFLVDTPCRLAVRLPSVREGSGTSSVWHGSVVVGRGPWYDD